MPGDASVPVWQHGGMARSVGAAHAKAREEYTVLGARLRMAREAAKMSLNELARRVGVSSSEFSRIETGQKKRIDFSTIDKAAAVLGVPLEHFAIAHRADVHEAKTRPHVKAAADMARAEGVPEWAIDAVVMADPPPPEAWTANDFYNAFLLAHRSGRGSSGVRWAAVAPTKPSK